MNLQEVYEEICELVNQDSLKSDSEKFEEVFGFPYVDKGDPWKTVIKKERSYENES